MSRDELTKEYNQLIEQRQSMWANADEMSKRELSTEESATLAKCVDDIRQMDARIATLENEIGNTEDQAVEAPADIVESVRSLPPTPKPIVARAPAYVRDYSDRNFHRNQDLAFRGWMLQHRAGDDHHKAARSIGFDLRSRSITVLVNTSAKDSHEQRAAGDPMGTKVAGKGKEFVPTEFSTEYVKHLKYLCPIRQFCKTLTTSTGRKIEYPVVNDTGVGVWINESDAKPLDEFSSANIVLDSFKCVSKIVKVSEEMLRDSMIPLAQILGESLGMRVARAQEQKFLVGTGSGEPQGIVTGASAGGTTATAGALTISDLLTLYYSVDPAYREAPGAAFIVSDQTLMALHNTRLGAPGDPALVTDFRDPKAPMKLFGRPIIVSNSMPTGVTAGTVAAVFGDLGSFLIRDCAGIELKVTEHLYWANNQIGYLAEAFSDSRVMNADAIKKLAYK